MHSEILFLLIKEEGRGVLYIRTGGPGIAFKCLGTCSTRSPQRARKAIVIRDYHS